MLRYSSVFLLCALVFGFLLWVLPNRIHQRSSEELARGIEEILTLQTDFRFDSNPQASINSTIQADVDGCILTITTDRSGNSFCSSIADAVNSSTHTYFLRYIEEVTVRRAGMASILSFRVQLQERELASERGQALAIRSYSRCDGQVFLSTDTVSPIGVLLPPGLGEEVVEILSEYNSRFCPSQ